MLTEQNQKFSEILIQNWSRKKQFEHFTTNFVSPWFDMTVAVDVSNFLISCKENKISFFHSFVFLLAKSLNALESFRMRIRQDKVIIWDRVHPQYTVLSKEENVLFCPVKFDDNFLAFYNQSRVAAQEVTEKGLFHETSQESDDKLLFSCLPWISFTTVNQPIFKNIFDSRPRVVWGKYFFDKAQNKTLMPLQIMAHHATTDGLHMARAFEKIQSEIDQFKI